MLPSGTIQVWGVGIMKTGRCKALRMLSTERLERE
jgi:hypothetical protein